MAYGSNEFGAWEKELTTETRGAVLVDNSIDLAQNLQLGMLDAPYSQRFTMGMAALEILGQHPNPFRHNDYIVRSQKAYLTIHANPQTGEGFALRYGGMQLVGRIGHYTLDRFEDDWTLALQMFEPTQLSVDSPRDRIFNRLPAPLMLPVAAITPPFLAYEK